MGSYSIPDFWDNLNDFTNSSGIYTCIEGDPGNPSTNYLILRTENIPGKGVVTGKAVSGIIDTTTFTPISGIPFSSRPEKLNYIIQFMPYSASDPSNIYVSLTKWDTLNNIRDTVATGYTEFIGMAHSWFPMYTDLIYQSGDMPDSVCIVISSSSSNPLAGGYLYIDDLSFSGYVIGVNEYESEPYFSIFPNPTDDLITIENVEKTAHLEIYNATGKLMFTENINSIYRMDVHAWNPGVYLFRLRHQDNSVVVKKIIIR